MSPPVVFDDHGGELILARAHAKPDLLTRLPQA
jgi:hypothetical protein